MTGAAGSIWRSWVRAYWSGCRASLTCNRSFASSVSLRSLSFTLAGSSMMPM